MNAKNLALVVSILSFIGGSAAQLNSILTGVPHAPLVVQIIVGIAGYAGAIAGLVLAWMTRQEGQAQTVAANIDDPTVKRLIVPAVANLSGVDSVQVNKQADVTLAALAASRSPQFDKIEQAKP